MPLDELHLDPANTREHGERNLDSIRASLTRFGQAEPLVVLAKSKRVIGGNGRLVAMKDLGWTEADIVEVDLAKRVCRASDWNHSARVYRSHYSVEKSSLSSGAPRVR